MAVGVRHNPVYYSPRQPSNTFVVRLQTMEDLAQYLVTDDFWHAAVAGWMWWAWNPNSIDTGGIVRHVLTSLESLPSKCWSGVSASI